KPKKQLIILTKIPPAQGIVWYLIIYKLAIKKLLTKIVNIKQIKMKTNYLIKTLAVLLCFAGSVAFGQSANEATFTVDVRPSGNGWEVPRQQFTVTVGPKYEQSGGKYTPNGCGVSVTPVIDGSSPNYVKQIRYNGQVINVPDGFKNRRTTNGAFSGAGAVASFQVSVN